MRKEYKRGQGYTKEDWDAVSDNPEWTKQDLAQAKLMKEALPELHAAITEVIRKQGPVRTKAAVSIRLDIDIVQKLRNSGPGWQSRVNDILRRHMDRSAA